MKPMRSPFVLTAVAALISVAFTPAAVGAEALQAKPQGAERLSALLVRQGWLPGLHAQQYRLSSLLVLAPSSADALEQQMARDRAIQNLRSPTAHREAETAKAHRG